MGVFRRREVSRNKITKANFYLLPRLDNHYESELMLFRYQQRCLKIIKILIDFQAQEDSGEYDLVMDMGPHTRYQAEQLMCMLHGEMHNPLNPDVENLHYTVDWWYRSPSSAGLGRCLIAFRIHGLYELADLT